MKQKNKMTTSVFFIQITHRYGMTLFIASEVMFFVAWFWAFLSSHSQIEIFGKMWPPAESSQNFDS